MLEKKIRKKGVAISTCVVIIPIPNLSFTISGNWLRSLMIFVWYNTLERKPVLFNDCKETKAVTMAGKASGKYGKNDHLLFVMAVLKNRTPVIASNREISMEQTAI